MIGLIAAMLMQTPPDIPIFHHAPGTPSPYFLDSSTVVRVMCESGSGSAFYIGHGRYVSAAHVATPNERCFIRGSRVKILQRGSKLDYEILSAGYHAPYRAIISCEPFREGIPYYATGYAEGNPWTVTQRLIASAQRDGWDREITLRGSVTAGQSGGPVSDDDGLVHGIVTSGADDGITQSYFVQLSDTPLCGKGAAR